MTFVVVTDWIDGKPFVLNLNQITFMKRLRFKTEVFLTNGDSVYIEEKPSLLLGEMRRAVPSEELDEDSNSIDQLTIFDLKPIVRERNV